MKRGRGLLTGVLALGLLLASAPAASANHHVMRISEVYPGEIADPDEEYVELQMLGAGQEFVSNQLHVRLYNAAGTQVYEEEFLTDVQNGVSQATVLAGDPFFTPDLAFDAAPAGYAAGVGGAACITSDSFGLLDCVAWGSFNDPPPTAVIGAGTPEAAIPDAFSISRTQARGCATLMEGVDDSDNSDADFSSTEATPRNNAAAITEVPCTTPPPPGGGGTTPATPAPDGAQEEEVQEAEEALGDGREEEVQEEEVSRTGYFV